MNGIAIITFLIGAFLLVGSTAVPDNKVPAFIFFGMLLMAASLHWGFV